MKNILLIDDEEDFRLMLKKILESEGYYVFTAADGNEGLEIFKKKLIDLVITDIIMPNKEGIATMLDLVECNPQVKIIAISGTIWMNEGEFKDQVKELGAMRVFKKPFNMDEFIQTIKELA